jgi:hypothetical protein
MCTGGDDSVVHTAYGIIPGLRVVRFISWNFDLDISHKDSSELVLI